MLIEMKNQDMIEKMSDVHDIDKNIQKQRPTTNKNNKEASKTTGAPQNRNNLTGPSKFSKSNSSKVISNSQHQTKGIQSQIYTKSSNKRNKSKPAYNNNTVNTEESIYGNTLFRVRLIFNSIGQCSSERRSVLYYGC